MFKMKYMLICEHFQMKKTLYFLEGIPISTWDCSGRSKIIFFMSCHYIVNKLHSNSIYFIKANHHHSSKEISSVSVYRSCPHISPVTVFVCFLSCSFLFHMCYSPQSTIDLSLPWLLSLLGFSVV